MASGPLLFLGKGVSNLSIEKIFLGLGFKHKKDFFFFSKVPGETDFENLETALSVSKATTLIVSPGFPLANPLIINFRKVPGNLITSELNFAALVLDQENCIGITGSLGKSTTTALLGEALKVCDPDIFVGGNLGTPLGEYAFEVLFENRKPAKWVVLELSSFQLENCENLKLAQAGLTYLSANHLERYESLAHYYDTKFEILNLLGPEGFLHVNAFGGDAASEISRRKVKNAILADPQDPQIEKYLPEKPKLLGVHNRQNMAVVVSVLKKLRAPEECLVQLSSFPGLEHRMEFVGEKNGIQWINDSKATALDSVECAIQGALVGLGPKSKLWVLLGGRDKKHPWRELKKFATHSQINALCFGEARKLIQNEIGMDHGSDFAKLTLALDWVAAQAKSGDRVLLSPGGTSLDEFKNFNERGRVFKEFFKNLK